MNLVSQEAVQDMGIRATTTLNKVSHFFNFHMIDNYGCDYSTSGLAMDYLESKLKAFFDRRMSDGPKYDTYILYFSGDVYENGEWAMSGMVYIKAKSGTKCSYRVYIKHINIFKTLQYSYSRYN